MAQETERDGRSGVHGGQYIPETLMSAVIELEEAYKHYKDDPKFNVEPMEPLNECAGRPSRLYYAKHMTGDLSGAKICLGHKGLNHIGVHKISDTLGQALLVKHMGEKHLTAETDTGQHGVTTTTVATLLNMGCVVYMGEEDTMRQALDVYRMRLLGVEAMAVKTGTRALKDTVPEVTREQTARIEDTHYCIGSCMGSHPFPTMVRDFRVIISKKTKEEMQQKERRPLDAVITCVGGGSNAVSSFYHSIGDESVRLIGCKAAGRSIHTMETAATVNMGSLSIFHRTKSYFCQGKYGQAAPAYSISAGLGCPGVGPEHAYLHDLHRVEYVSVMDGETVGISEYLARAEGVIPTIESAHAMAYARKLTPTVGRDKVIVVMLSGHSDKDVTAIVHYRRENLHE